MNLMKWRYLYFAISLVVIIPGLVSIFTFGFKPAIDFTGGSLWEVAWVAPAPDATTSAALATPTVETVRETVSSVYEVNAVQPTGENQFLVRGKTIDNTSKQLALFKLEETFGPVTELQFATVGPTLGRETLVKMTIAVLMVAGIITGYIWYQFHELRYGVSAIIAMLHDSLVLIGVFSILGRLWNVEVDVLFVTALLTTLSFSVHDTIVVFDRIRELRRKHRNYPLREVINAAVLETLGRSLNNSLTIIIMLLTLVLLGGETIRWFAVALLVGAITGTYSSTFTAAPLLLLWEDLHKRARKKHS